MLLPTLKEKTCAQCGTQFRPFSSTSRVCSPVCASKWVRAEKKSERAEFRARKEKLKPRAKWLAEAQAVVNRYVRLLALSRGEGCYTCGATPEQKFGGTYDAGHFRSVGSAPHLRYWTPQIKLQCIPCNRHKGGMALAFRQALVREHGSEWVERLEAMHHTAKFDIPYLIRLKAVFAKKTRRLEKRSKQ